MTERRTIWLAFGCVIFAATIAAELRDTGDLTSAFSGLPGSTATAPRPDRPPLPPPERLIATALARPLFSPTRRPQSSAGPAAAELTGKRLAGIVISPTQRLAIFAVAGAKPLVVKEGADIGGWRIEAITPYDVSLSGPSGTRTLHPKMDTHLLFRSDETAGTSRAGRAVPPPPPGGVLRHRVQ